MIWIIDLIVCAVLVFLLNGKLPGSTVGKVRNICAIVFFTTLLFEVFADFTSIPHDFKGMLIMLVTGLAALITTLMYSAQKRKF